jgi:REP element-mobilizing transposase RayT
LLRLESHPLRGYTLPLYLYAFRRRDKGGQKDLHEQSPWPPGEGGRVPNLNPDFIAEMEKCLGVKFDVRSTGVPPVGHGLEAHATDDALRVRQGAHLPHWTREGATYAVTFRLADSLPQAALQKLMEEREWASRRAQGQKASDSDGERRLRRLQSEKMEEYLDAGHGKSWLRKDAVAEVVADAVRFFDGNRYDLAAWCVMPNHVHVVVRPMGSNDLPEIVHSWKSFSAKRANRILKRTGKFWQTEYYEHLIRDEKDFRRRVEYVLTNPERVGLKEWKWRGGSLYGTGVPPAGHGLEAHATVGPEDVFHYIYAIFHSPTYRQRYAEFLKIDFPRVPLTSDRELFRRLCALGRELVGLHLLDSPAVSNLITRYPIPGDHPVEKGHPKYVPPGEPEPGTGKPLEHGRVYINKTQHFEGVPPEVWEFHVGGYQPMEKWLKDRRGRALSYEDLQHYQNIAVALKETIRLMAEIDGAIPSWALQ